MLFVWIFAFLTGLQHCHFCTASSTPSNDIGGVSLPPPPSLSTHTKVCVIGAGSTGASFCAVFLAHGKQVTCYDPFVDRDTLYQRIESVWPYLQARGFTQQPQPPWANLQFTSSDIAGALRGVEWIQECTLETLQGKQVLLGELDQLADPRALIASSTSYIPHDLLVKNCRNHKHRIVVAHPPTSPYLDSLLEIFGTHPEWVAHAQTLYHSAGFDVILMSKLIHGHVWNSFFKLNLKHASKLVRQGVCTPQDVNTVLRHLGRDFCMRNSYLSHLSTIGGDRGLRGGLALQEDMARTAVEILVYAILKKLWMPDWIAMTTSQILGRYLVAILEPSPLFAYLTACQEFQDQIVAASTINDHERLDVSTALFCAFSTVYQQCPLEVHNDPFRSPKLLDESGEMLDDDDDEFM